MNAPAAPTPIPPVTQRMGQQGGLPALLVHCFLGHSGLWQGLVGAMVPPLDALALDMPGHGRAPPWDDPSGSGDFQADVTAQLAGLVAAQAGQGAPLLIGHSFGATVALRHALERPESVRGLVLFEPVFFAAAAAEPEFAAHQRDEAALRAAFAEGNMEAAARAFMQINGDAPDWDSLPERQRARFTAQMPLIAASRPGVFLDSGGQLAPGRMEAFSLPVLLITGARSPTIFRAISRALAGRLGQAEWQSLPGAGHMVPVTHARDCAGLISDWMLRHGLD